MTTPQGPMPPGTTPAVPGWYLVSRGVQRWFDGREWTDHALAAGKPTTVTALLRRNTVMLWAGLGVGALAWGLFIWTWMTTGSSAAYLLAWTPVIGTAWVIMTLVMTSRVRAALPPTQDAPPQQR